MMQDRGCAVWCHSSTTNKHRATSRWIQPADSRRQEISTNAREREIVYMFESAKRIARSYFCRRQSLCSLNLKMHEKNVMNSSPTSLCVHTLIYTLASISFIKNWSLIFSTFHCFVSVDSSCAILFLCSFSFSRRRSTSALRNMQATRKLGAARKSNVFRFRWHTKCEHSTSRTTTFNSRLRCCWKA